MKVEIGSRYDGPSLDRPCIRQMPHHWVLEETKVSWVEWLAIAIIRIIRG